MKSKITLALLALVLVWLVLIVQTRNASATPASSYPSHSSVQEPKGGPTATATPTPSCGPPGWQEKAFYPVNILDQAVAAQGGIVYSFSGVTSAAVTANSYKYNPATNTWTSIAPLPSARQLASAVSDGTYIYILGGSDAYLGGSVTSTLYRYNPATDTYVQLAPYNVPTTAQAAAFLNGKIYRIAGCSTPNCSAILSSVDVYDISSNTWSMAANYPISMGLFTATGLDGYVWAAGGDFGQGSKAYRYDPLTNIWDDAALADLSQTRSSPSSGVVNGRWIIAGGSGSGGVGYSAVVYNPGTNSWSSLPPMPNPSARGGAASTGSTLYVVGGIWPGGGGIGTSYTSAYTEIPCATATPTAIRTSTATTVTATASTTAPTGTPLATPTACTNTYTYSTSTGSLLQGTTLLAGSQCAHCIVPIAFPFPFTFYGQAYTSANIASYGNLQFLTASTSFNSCPPGYPQLGPAILPYWDDTIDMAQSQICLSLAQRPCGIYTSVSGTAPNRQFHIEWLGRRSGSNTYIINFELRLYETTGVFDFVYGAIRPPGAQNSSIGIQDGSSQFISYACHVIDSTYQGLLLRWTPLTCGATSTPVPTFTSTSTPTSTLPAPTGTPTTSATVLSTSTSISTPTSTSVGATATTAATQTPGGATATPQPTATACSISFSDVPSDSTFYPFIRCLACRGIISGYSDGTFRPGNDITRGQIAKMVSNAAGFQEDAGPQVFEDVDATNTFYTWINRLSNRGFMGGYACGTIPEEPCIMPDNKPYFRPFANTTRGQLAKIVSNAAEVGGTPTGLYYTDVPEDNPFYLWIMRLTNIGVMSGYDCGRPLEPCDDQNRPYFRPFANVTRGQASKIVANTFLPNCQTPQR